MAIKQDLETAKLKDDDSKAKLDALLTYANGVTEQTDTNIGDAIKTLADGYGHGGGENRLNIMLSGKTFELTKEDLADVTVLPQYAFNESGITKATIPATVNIDANGIFKNCKKLEILVLEEGIEKLGGNYICEGTTSLREVYIPASLRSTGYQSFTNTNKNLQKKVYYGGTIEQWCAIEFGNGRQGNPCSDNGALYINGEEIIDLVIPKTITAFSGEGGQFANMKRLKTVIFNSFLTNLQTTDFWGDTGITDIYVPWAEGEVAGAPWGATNAIIHYNYVPEEG